MLNKEGAWLGASFEGGLKHHFYHGVRGQRPINCIQLFTTRGPNGQSDAQILARGAFSKFDRASVKLRVKRLGNLSQRVNKVVHFGSHDFDGEVTGVLNEGVFGVNHGQSQCVAVVANTAITANATRPFQMMG